MKRAALIAVVLAAVTLILAAPGVNGFEALRVLFEGAFGSAYAVHSNTLVRWTPLALTGLAVALAFQAGVWNIGAEGQLLAGAVAALAVAPHAGPWAALAAAMLGGMAWGLIAAFWVRRFGASVVVVTIMLSFIAELAVSLLVNGVLQEPTGVYPQSAPLAASALLGRMEGTRVHAGMPVTAWVMVMGWVFLYRTASGYRLRATGANPIAARYSGRIDTASIQFGALILSAGIAGLAGGIELMGVTGVLYERFTPGYGYIAIAVALAGALHPLGIALSALLFAALESGAANLQREAGVPASITLIIEGVALLVSLWAVQRRVGR